MGMTDALIAKTLAGFKGVKRRFTRTGIVDGVTIIDDYGHHPVEITAVLAAARAAVENAARVIAVVQPHRYTRLADLFEDFCTCFNDADAVIVANVHTAGEEPIEGADRDSLVEGLRSRGHRLVIPLVDDTALAPIIKEMSDPGDLVVCLGAGNITAWANALPDQLKALGGKPS
jgi:UDP-N-acetylmuramate--alanine ligase